MSLEIRVSGNRRQHPRIPVDFDVFSRRTGKHIGRAINLSPDGLFIESEENFCRGTKLLLDCKITDQPHPVKAYCDVRWIHANGEKHRGVGVRFLSIYDSDKNRLKKHIEDIIRRVDSDNLSLADYVEVSDKNIFKKAELFWEFIEDTNKKNFNKYGTPLQSATKNRVVIVDKKSGEEREVIMMGTSNYLGLQVHPRVIEAAKNALLEYGTGNGSVRLLSGTHKMHQELEEKLAEFKGFEAAVVFPTGHMANMGCISSILGRKDVAIIDKMVHASILDGCNLGLGSYRSFRHGDMDHLRQLLETISDRYEGKLIIVEGVDGIDGDIVPLPDVCDIADEFGAKILLDEAHATGVIGDHGRGTLSHFQMHGRVDIVMDSLSKALGGLGGYIASSKEISRYVYYYARTAFFSVSPPPTTLAAAAAAVNVLETEPEIVEQLWSNVKYVRENLSSMGYNNVDKSESAIMSTIIGDELLLRKMNKRIFEEGVYLEPLPYPAVARGQERLRLRIMATHTREDLDKTLEIFEKVGKEHNFLKKTYKIPTPETHQEQTPTDSLKLEKVDKDLEIREILSHDQMVKSLKLSWEVYQDKPNWVPYFLIKDRVKLLSGDHHTYFKRNIRSKRFIATENGNIVATLSAFVDKRHNSYWDEKVGFLGYFEAMPHSDNAVAALVNSAHEYLAKEGMEEVVAPVQVPLVFYGGGLINDSNNVTPSFLQPYTPEYYKDYFTNLGYKPLKTLHHYSIDLTSEDNIKLIEDTIRSNNAEIRELNKGKYERDSKYVLDIYNEAFPRLWKYAPFEEDEFIEFVREFRDLIMQGLWLISEVEGKSVGFIGGFPQCAPIFKMASGELGPTELSSIPRELGRIREGAIVLMGVLGEYSNRGIGLSLLAHICRNMIEKGYRKATCTWEMVDGDKNNLITELGGVEDDVNWTLYKRRIKDKN